MQIIDKMKKMEISAFSKDNFDPVDLINKICKSEEARTNIEAHLSTILMKLQLYIQRVNASFEETNLNVLCNIPKILRDTHLLEQEALALKDKMQSVRVELENVEKSATSSIYILKELNQISTELTNKTQVLNESKNWKVLVNNIEDILELGNEENIAYMLFNMKKSLLMLIDTPDFEDKKLQLEGFKNRLEAIVSPKLVHAFTSGNFDESKIYVDIFSKMDRLPQLLQYYHNCQKLFLVQEWRKTVDFTQNKNIKYCIKVYYDKLLFFFHDQIKWCNQTLPNFNLIILVELFTDLLNDLSSSIIECIDTGLKQQSNLMKLSILVELEQFASQFAMNLNIALQMILKDKISDHNCLVLAEAIYAPYVPFVARYSTYEISFLTQQLNMLEFFHDDLSDTINALSINLPKIMNYVDDANKRCKLFTKGCAYPNLIKAFDIFFDKYQEKFKISMSQLSKRKIKYEDWNLFQMCLILLQTAGEYMRLIEKFEKSLLTDIVETYIKLQSQELSIFQQYKILLLSPAEQIELDEFIIKIQKDKSVLDSTLKSIQRFCGELHRSTYEVIFAPIFTQLVQIQKAFASKLNENKLSSVNLDLPDYSFAPQEYITQVGQYLMTLPQHLEPFLLKDNPNLTKALKASNLQYNQESCESDFTNIVLGIVAKETCQMFQDQSWGIYELNCVACKQLAVDIDYLGNILEELGLSLSENLQQMSLLLRLQPENYHSGSSGCNARVVAAVRQMRNITSSG